MCINVGCTCPDMYVGMGCLPLISSPGDSGGRRPVTIFAGFGQRDVLPSPRHAQPIVSLTLLNWSLSSLFVQHPSLGTFQ